MKKRKYKFFPDNIDSVAQAKLNYKRLALLYHPDKGGKEELMRELNREYDLLKRELDKKTAVIPARKVVKSDFTQVRIGDTVFVNGTECVVKGVFPHSFIAQAKGRLKMAIFDKRTGRALYTKKTYKASWYKKG